MRYIRTVIIPRDGPFHPIDGRFAETEGITRERLHNLNLLDDGSAVVLYEFSGDAERIRAVLEEFTDDLLYEYQLTTGDQRTTVYAHFEPTQDIVDLLSLFREHELILDMPLEYTSRGGLQALIIGDVDVIREIMPELPDGIDVKLEQMGDYEPEAERLFTQLTPKQQETLLAALEVGYYSVPREATQEEVARKIGRSDGTVGEHLRKIEATILTAVAPR